MIRFHFAFFLSLGFCLSLLPAQAQMYRWTDEHGNVHFSDKPHANAKKLEIRTPRSSGIGTSRSQSRSRQQLLKDLEYSRQKREQRAERDAVQRERNEQECRRLKNRLRNYEEVDYVFYRDDSGKKKRISSQQKKRDEQKLRDRIADKC